MVERRLCTAEASGSNRTNILVCCVEVPTGPFIFISSMRYRMIAYVGQDNILIDATVHK